MTDKHQDTAWSRPLRVSELPSKKVHSFELQADATTRKAMAADLGILDIKKLRFHGKLEPLGRKDWALKGQIGATVVQPCVVTLAPVTTRIDEPVARTFIHEAPEYEEGSETEMPEDETTEVLPRVLDLGGIMYEALAINLPLYPRAEDAELENANFTQPGQDAMTDEDARPFAGLKSLRDKLENGDG